MTEFGASWVDLQRFKALALSGTMSLSLNDTYNVDGVIYRWLGTDFFAMGKDYLAVEVASYGAAGRPVLLGYGNSVAQNQRLEIAACKTTVLTNTRAGVTVIPVANDLTTDVAVIPGANLVVTTYSDSWFTAKVVSKTSNSITIDRKIPRALAAGKGLTIYPTNRPTNIRTTGNLIGCWNALNGTPFELCPNYSYSGAQSWEMLPDFAPWLNFHRPAYVMLQLFENDIPASRTFAQMKQALTSYLSICSSAGVIPIVVMSYPSSGITGSTRASQYDQLANYITSLSGNVIGVDPGNAWLDKVNTTDRVPLAGWTDGVHLNANFYWRAAAVLQGVLNNKLLLPIIPKSNIAFDYLPTTGTGGSVNGDTTPTGVFAAGFEAGLFGAGTTLVGSKTSDDYQRLVYTIPGAANNGATVFYYSTLSRSLSFASGGQPFKASCEISLSTKSTKAGTMWIQVDFNTGESYSGHIVTPSFDDPTVAGKTITLETPTVVVPEGAASYTLALYCFPTSAGSPSGVFVDIIIKSFALLPASSGNFIDSLPVVL